MRHIFLHSGGLRLVARAAASASTAARLRAIGDGLGEAARLLAEEAQLVVFKEQSGGSTAVPQSWGKKMKKKFGIEEAPPC